MWYVLCGENITRGKILKAKGKRKSFGPLLGNKCQCGGYVVKTARGRCRGVYIYSEPKCDRCNRLYPDAKGVKLVGEDKFLKDLGAHSRA